jgi:hypothetical protein
MAVRRFLAERGAEETLLPVLSNLLEQNADPDVLDRLWADVKLAHLSEGEAAEQLLDMLEKLVADARSSPVGRTGARLRSAAA